MVYVILGAGLQGPATAYAISILKPEATIWLVEKNQAAFKKAKWLLKNKLNCNNIKFLLNDSKTPILDPFRQIENLTILSTLPYYLNEAIAREAIKRGWNYFDLGGHVQTSEKIAEMAPNDDKGSTIMTDLGLAPGFVNILGQHALTLVKHPVSLHMFCGGLPLNPFTNEANYSIVFSPEGLINEYFNECQALKGGHIVDVEPMGDLEPVQIEGVTYEAFNTSGGAHTTLKTAQRAGLQHCSYKTLRYLGHAKIFRFLHNTVGMTKDELVDLVETSISPTTDDKVIIAIKVLGRTNYVVNYQIEKTEDFTAMQRATGFCAAATALQIERYGGLVTYGDINATELIETLSDQLLPELT
jgi:saccharopine dehydrogenase (NAD+, L-lysine-forming)